MALTVEEQAIQKEAKERYDVFIKSYKNRYIPQHIGILVEGFVFDEVKKELKFTHEGKNILIPSKRLLYPKISKSTDIDYINKKSKIILIFLKISTLFNATKLYHTVQCTPGTGGGCTMPHPPIGTSGPLGTLLCPYVQQIYGRLDLNVQPLPEIDDIELFKYEL
jgi:hypothetical protein